MLEATLSCACPASPLPWVPQFEAACPDKAAQVCVGCQSGKRSEAAARMLADAGFSGVVNIEGGFSGELRM